MVGWLKGADQGAWGRTAEGGRQSESVRLFWRLHRPPSSHCYSLAFDLRSMRNLLKKGFERVNFERPRGPSEGARLVQPLPLQSPGYICLLEPEPLDSSYERTLRTSGEDRWGSESSSSGPPAGLPPGLSGARAETSRTLPLCSSSFPQNHK